MAATTSTSTSTSTGLIVTVLMFYFLIATPFCSACGGCTTATPPVSPVGKCPLNTLKLGVCADVLGLVHAVLGAPPSGTTPCCTLIKGLADLEAAACLCTAIKANVLGLNLNVPVALGVILSACQKDVPPSFQC